ncbi:MAG: hypothetical protein QM640_10220 [Niabella sp.]
MASFQEQIAQIKNLRAACNQADQKTYSQKLSIQKKFSVSDPQALAKALKKSETAYRRAGSSLNNAIKQLHASDFRTLTKELNGAVPLVMLPVRIETRFVNPPVVTAPELWIRIFPDDIHTNTHEPALTQAEIDAGETYWKSIAKTGTGNSTTDIEESRKDIWLQFKEKVTGAQRAIWVAKTTQPVNCANTTVAPPASLQFPQYADIKDYAWTRAPRTQALPDRFIVTIYKNNTPVFEQAGNIIPDTVFLGPDPMAAQDAIQNIDTEIKFNEDIDWLQDFDKAVANGLGMKIPLQPAMYSTGNIIQRITVSGVAHSADADTGKTLLQNLFENHHYASKGLSFLPQETPTNNTEKDGSGYTKNEDLLSKGYYTGETAVVSPGSDLDLFTKILGVDTNNLHELNHSDLKEHANALNMNTALYAATLSYYFKVLMKPAVTENDANAIRSFFTTYVSARGPLAPIRVGDQPYGLLLSSDLTRWTESGSKFFIGLTEVLKRLQLVWDTFVGSKVLSVAGGGTSDTLLRILGLQPGSVAFRQRLGNLPDYSYSLQGINTDTLKAQALTLNHIIVNFLKTLGYTLSDENYYPFIADLIFYDQTTPLSDKKLVLPDVAVSDTTFLPLLPKSQLNYIAWMAQKATLSALETVNFDGDKPPRTLLCLLLRHSLLSELMQTGTKFYTDNKLTINAAVFEKSLYNFNKNAPDLTTYEFLRGEPQKLDNTKFAAIRGNIADYLLSTSGLRTNPYIPGMKKAMAALSTLSTAELQKNLSAFTDLCAYRLDAWQTGLFTRRALTNRNATPTGVYIGAYGWVENLKAETHTAVALTSVPEKLKPANGMAPFKLKENAGFTHVPSLNHATAMGLLLAGYKNHADRSNPDAFAINLSSERTRNALNILKGVSNGQTIEVLLGYQFERALHDFTTSGKGNLNQYIYEFRNKYDVENISIPQQGAAEAQETIGVYPVVNGLKVLRAPSAEILSIVTDTGLQGAVLKIKDKLADTLDACNDLLLAESAYQLTQGNQDRTSSVLNATLLADTPPEIQVTDTPRSSLLTYTHRITVHFDTDIAAATAGSGWPEKASPRSAFEPGLNQWLSQLIGNPENIICTAAALDEKGNETGAQTISLADLNMQPIDLVYIIPEDLAGGATELESRIAFYYRKSEKPEPSTSVSISFEPEHLEAPEVSLARIYPLLRNLKILLGNARAANAKDFASKQKTENIQVNETGIDFSELDQRISQALNNLANEFTLFNKTAPNDNLPKDEFNPETFEAFFTILLGKPGEKSRYDLLDLNNEAIDAVTNFQIMTTGYGVQLAYPENLTLITRQSKQELLEKTFNTWKIIDEKIKKATGTLSAAQAEINITNKLNLYTAAAKTVLGDDFVPLPQFKYSNPDILDKTFSDEKQLLSYIQKVNNNSDAVNKESWLQSVSRIRKAVAGLETVRIMSEAATGSEIIFKMAQVPFRPDDSWLGFEFPQEYNGSPFNIMEDTIALSINGAAATKTASSQSAIIIDEWTEKIPIDEEVTGVAYHYNQPNACAPQSVIVAIEPTGSGKWDWDVLQGVLSDTLRRAKSRAVEPDHIIEHTALSVLLPMTVASFDVNEANVSLDYLLLSDKFLKIATAANLQLYKKWN